MPARALLALPAPPALEGQAAAGPGRHAEPRGEARADDGPAGLGGVSERGRFIANGTAGKLGGGAARVTTFLYPFHDVSFPSFFPTENVCRTGLLTVTTHPIMVQG